MRLGVAAEIDILSRLQADIGLTPILALTDTLPQALLFTFDVKDLYTVDLNVKKGLDGLADFQLVGIGNDAKRILAVSVGCQCRFLGDYWPQNHF